jgi:ketosteroid isomerase-like protein
MEIIARGTQLGSLPRMGIPATRKRMESFGVSVIETRDGKIYGERDYFDTATIRQQLSIS